MDRKQINGNVVLLVAKFKSFQPDDQFVVNSTQRRDNDRPRSVDFSLCLARHLLRELRYGSGKTRINQISLLFH